MLAAFVFSFFAQCRFRLFPKNWMRYVVFFLLIIIAIYTLAKKDLGQIHTVLQTGKRKFALGLFFAH